MRKAAAPPKRCRKRKSASATCAFCGAEATTRDHIPSRKFFPSPRPADLITVPACGGCNNFTSADEEYFLLRVVASAGAASDEATAVSDERLSRILTPRRLKALRRLADEARRVSLKTPAGLHVGDSYAYPIDMVIVRRVLEKIVRGLYYHEFRRLVPEHMGLVTDLEPDRVMMDHPAAQALLRTPSRIRGRSVFEYKVQVSGDNPDSAMFFMVFFGGVLAVGAVLRKENAQRLRAPLMGRR